MTFTYADFVIHELEELPLDTPLPGEDESFEDWKDRITTADREVWQDEIWQQRNGWMM